MQSNSKFPDNLTLIISLHPLPQYSLKGLSDVIENKNPFINIFKNLSWTTTICSQWDSNSFSTKARSKQRFVISNIESAFFPWLRKFEKSILWRNLGKMVD